LNPSISGGISGKTAGGTGIAHGAQPGQNGQVAPITSDPFATVNDDGCLPKLTVWKATTTPQITQGGIATYKITVSNGPGRTTATEVEIQDVLPTGFTYQSTTSLTLGTGVTRTTVTNPTVGSTTVVWGKFSIPPGEQLEIVFQAASNPTIAPGTYQNPVIANYLDPKRVNPTDTTSSSYDAVTNAGEDVTVVAPTGSNTNVLLVKRITAINGDRTKNPNDNTPLNVFVDDTTSTKAAEDNDSKWVTNYLKGAINAGKVKPGDTIEYTVYFLNAGNANANSVRICDRIRPNQIFQPNGYVVGTGVQVQMGTSSVINLTNANDSSDRTQFIAAGTAPPGNCNITAANTDGTLVVDITGAAATGNPTLVTMPGATAAGSPNDSYGFFRFITQVNP
jgi:uncharacterized repeat protein (TIGR01451 family)